jgi:hypothetical protein
MIRNSDVLVSAICVICLVLIIIPIFLIYDGVNRNSNETACMLECDVICHDPRYCLQLAECIPCVRCRKLCDGDDEIAGGFIALIACIVFNIINAFLCYDQFIRHHYHLTSQTPTIIQTSGV